MSSILKYILLTAIRDKLYIGLFIILLGAFGLSSIMGGASIIEKVETSTVFIAGSIRLIFAIGIILFTCFHIRKSFDHREVEFILSKNISRHKFILAYLLGFFLVALFILIPLAIALYFFVNPNFEGLCYFIVSLAFEILIIITFAIVASLILSSAVSAALATISFYFISRMMGFFVLTVSIPQSVSQISNLQSFLNSILKSISVIFPRLDLFASTSWLIYGVENFYDIKIIFTQSLIYIPLIIFVAFYDFRKKQF